MTNKKSRKKRIKKEKPSSKKLVYDLDIESKKGYLNKVLDYINEMLLRGYKKEVISRKLLSIGWPKNIVKKALSKVEDKKNFLVKKASEHFFGRLLFISIISMLILVYILLIFNQFFVKLMYFKSELLYVVLGILVVSLIILLHPRLLYKKISHVLSDLKEKGRERKRAREKGKIRRLLEKKRKEAERLRLKEKKKREKLLEKRRRKIESLRLKEKKRALKGKRPGIFSRMFKKKGREEKKEKEEAKKEETKKEKIPLVKELSKSLKIDIGRYETDLDVLYKVIEKKGRIKLSAVSKYFGIDKRKVDEWATILQEHNLAEIHYPAIGEAELRRKKSEQTGIKE